MSDETRSFRPSDPAQQERLEAVLAEYLRRVEAGEEVDRQAILSEHPDLAADLREFFANQAHLARIVGNPQGSSSASSAPTRPMKVRYFGDYEILEEIAQGGMGVVYKARQVSLNRLVAVKMILAGQLANDSEVKRFQAEAEAAANLRHPGVVPIYEVGLHDGQHYFSMEYVEGRTLSQLARDSSLSATKAAEYVREMAEIVQYAHDQGVLHRDLKPSNVLIDTDDRVRITDFGLAKRVTGDSDLTLTGQVIGTPSYMPPEQAAAQHTIIGTTADVYALGAILYELLTGRPPFRADNIGETLRQVQHDDPVRPRLLAPKLPRDLETICLKCLEKEPRRRYATAQELADELGRFLRGEPIHARPVGFVERSWRWCRRKPLVAGLVSIALLAALTVVTTLVVSHFVVTSALRERTQALGDLNRAMTTLKGEELRTREALVGKTDALRELESSNQRVKSTLRHEQRVSYSQAIALAHREWQVNNVHYAEQILDSLDPEMRGWEWNYLKRLCHLESLSWQWPADAAKEGTSPDDGDVLAVNSVAFSPDGKYLACGSGDVAFGQNGQVKVWDLTTHHEIFTSSGSLGPVFKVAYSPDGTKLASVDKKRAIKIWDTATGEELTTMNGKSWILDIQFSPDGKQLATTPPTTLWDLESGEEVQTFPGGGYSVAFSHDGQRLAFAESTAIQIWDLASRKETMSLLGHKDAIYSVAFSPDGHRLASASNDGSAKVWDLTQGREIVSYRGHTSSVYRVAFSRDGEQIASVGGEYSNETQPGEVRIWDSSSAKDILTLRGHPSAATDLAFDPKGDRLATVSKDGSIKFWELSASRDVRVVAGGSSQLWDWPEGPEITSRKPKPLISPHGDLLAIAGSDHLVKIWHVVSGRELQSLRGHVGQVWGVSFHPDQPRIATCSGDRTVKIWDLETGRELLTLRGQLGELYDVAFSPDGKRLAARNIGGTVLIWDAVPAGERTSPSSMKP